ncbi:CYTH and CHAD domain-containing protein [Rugosimonospora acidiphila]|uniref:CYTH and CHAD domain-containing protein n=1 Tax=Rugosimonospora acidiphila TaxID=556531 RepID=A0ABP9SRA2_9ACTN
MATTTIERERKYEVPVDFAMPDLSALAGVVRVDDPAEFELDATYYDTPSLRLARHSVTLRRRAGGQDAGWHLKRPADARHPVDGERTETQEPPRERSAGVPEALAAQIRALSRAEPLEPVARVRTRRLQRPVTGRGGRVLALLADDVVTSEALREPVVIQQWRELEVELVDGPGAILDTVDAALRAAGARPARLPSKLAHALGDRYPKRRASAGGGATAARALTGYLRRQRDAILDTDPGVRATDPAAVHDMRVAIRRSRATLRTFGRLLDADGIAPLREELRWLGRALGSVRDGDVLARRLAQAADAEPAELMVGPVRAGIRERLAVEAARSRGELGRILDGDRYLRILDGLDALVDGAPPAGVTAKRLRRLAGRALRRADRRMAAADRARPRPTRRVPLPRPATGDPDAVLHEARKAYKRARYAVEMLVPLDGRAARRLARRLTAVQDALGAHQDAIVAGHLLRDYGMRAHLDGENAFSYGLLCARQREAASRALDELPRTRRRATRRRVRRWLE